MIKNQLKKLSKETCRILNEIKELIREEPARFNMEIWVADYTRRFRTKKELRQRGLPECATTACIGGFAQMLQAKSVSDLNRIIQRMQNENTDNFWEGARILRIDKAQASRLFITERWPSPFYGRYSRANNELSDLIWHGRSKRSLPKLKEIQKLLKDRAEIAIDRIDHFIATQGQE